MAVNESVRLDLDSIVEAKFGKGKVPRFVLSWLKKFIHQDHLNGILDQKEYLGVDFLEKAIEYYDVHLTVEGRENLPEDGRRYTFVSNHPLGGVDAVSVLAVIGRKYDGNIIIPANDILMAVKPIAEYTIPVNKFGGQSSSLSEQINGAFASDRQVVIFPAGLCSRKIDGVVQDLPWKKTFITKSKANQRDIVPIWFSGRNSWRFYFLDKLRNLLKLKLNIAMLTLPDELYRSQHKSYTMVIGKPIPWQTFTSEKKDIEWAAWVREQVYKLKK